MTPVLLTFWMVTLATFTAIIRALAAYRMADAQVVLAYGESRARRIEAEARRLEAMAILEGARQHRFGAPSE